MPEPAYSNPASISGGTEPARSLASGVLMPKSTADANATARPAVMASGRACGVRSWHDYARHRPTASRRGVRGVARYRESNAVRAARLAQTLHPAAGTQPPVMGMDGPSAHEAIGRYQDSFKAPPPVVNVINIGGAVSGGSGQ